MKKMNINNFEEELICETLDNGFEIYLLPITNKKNYITIIGTKYGGADTKFKIDGKEVTTPSGIAHFLEHKLFEREDNPFAFYAKSGTDVNASTTLDTTTYYFTGNNNYEENLEYLLNWIKKFDVTDEQVEKEKKIILEEARMHVDNPDRILYEKSKENILVKHPYRIQTIGTEEDINSITKEDLKLCYNTFYKPNNMFLIAAGNFNYEKALEIIKEKMENLKNNKSKVEKIKVEEPDTPYKELEIINCNVKIPKIALSYKINKNLFKDLKIEKYFLDLYVYMVLSLGFGTTSDFREELLKEELFTSLGYQLFDTDMHYVISFIANTNEPEILSERIDDYIKNIKFDELAFERMKKTWIASEIRMIDNISVTAYNVLDDIMDYHCYKNEKIKDKKKMNYSTLLKVAKSLNFDNKSLLILTKEVK